MKVVGDTVLASLPKIAATVLKGAPKEQKVPQ
jgi:hypothetical protein